MTCLPDFLKAGLYLQSLPPQNKTYSEQNDYTDIRHMCIPLQQHLLIFIDLTAYFLLLPVLLAVFTSLPQNFIVNLSKGIYLIPFVTLPIPPPNISTAGSYASDTMAPLEMFWMCCFYLFFSPPSFPVNSHGHCFDVGETHFI